MIEDADQEIHLLLTDIIMPGVSGIHLAQQAREIRPDLPVLLMSGHNEEMLNQRVGLDTSSLLLRKPFTPEQLLASVRLCLPEDTAPPPNFVEPKRG